MSTRSDIIVHRADGQWHRIYCHFDGYLEGVGKTLFNHYTGQKKIEQLLTLGNLSALGEEIGKKHPFDNPPFYLPGGSSLVENPAYAAFKAKYGKWCRSYLRDRKLGQWHYAKTQAEFEAAERGEIGDRIQAVWPDINTWTEFTYVWADADIQEKPRDPCWWVADPDKGTQDLVNLGDALQGKITVCPSVKAFGMILGQHKALDPKDPNHGWTSLR